MTKKLIGAIGLSAGLLGLGGLAMPASAQVSTNNQSNNGGLGPSGPVNLGTGPVSASLNPTVTGQGQSLAQQLSSAQAAYAQAQDQLRNAQAVRPEESTVAPTGPRRFSRAAVDVASCGCNTPPVARAESGNAAAVASAQANVDATRQQLDSLNAQANQFLSSLERPSPELLQVTGGSSPLW
jgi:cytoskeletal protein RodZ